MLFSTCFGGTILNVARILVRISTRSAWRTVASVRVGLSDFDEVFRHTNSGRMLLVRTSRKQEPGDLVDALKMIAEGDFDWIILKHRLTHSAASPLPRRVQIMTEKLFNETAVKIGLPLRTTEFTGC